MSFARRLAISTVLFAVSPAQGQGPPRDSTISPGRLACDRLGPVAVRLLTGAERVQVAVRRWERPGDGSDLTGCVTVAQEKDQGADFAARLASLLFEDAVYASKPDSNWRAAGDPVLTF